MCAKFCLIYSFGDFILGRVITFHSCNCSVPLPQWFYFLLFTAATWYGGKTIGFGVKQTVRILTPINLAKLVNTSFPVKQQDSCEDWRRNFKWIVAHGGHSLNLNSLPSTWHNYAHLHCAARASAKSVLPQRVPSPIVWSIMEITFSH